MFVLAFVDPKSAVPPETPVVDVEPKSPPVAGAAEAPGAEEPKSPPDAGVELEVGAAVLPKRFGVEVEPNRPPPVVGPALEVDPKRPPPPPAGAAAVEELPNNPPPPPVLAAEVAPKRPVPLVGAAEAAGAPKEGFEAGGWPKRLELLVVEVEPKDPKGFEAPGLCKERVRSACSTYRDRDSRREGHAAVPTAPHRPDPRSFERLCDEAAYTV